jgi:gluconate 5-dehydrogenase
MAHLFVGGRKPFAEGGAAAVKLSGRLEAERFINASGGLGMLQELFGLTGRNALVTGSSRGVGLAIARGLGKAGATVILNGKDEDGLQRAQEFLVGEGIRAHTACFDVREASAIAGRIGAIRAEAGEIDILVNNAGIQIRGPLEEFRETDWQSILDVNLTGVFLTTKAVVPGMIRRRSGKIINVCSVQSELARPTIAPYTASKGALKMLTKGMATEWGKHNIQANAIAPGYLKTDLTRALYEDEAFNNWLCSRTPAHRWGELDELVGAAIFLASRASDYVNGHVLMVDGGLTACV